MVFLVFIGLRKMCVLRTRHALEQLGVAHLALPDVSEDVLHALGPPQEVKHSQVVAHALASEHLSHGEHCIVTPSAISAHTHNHTHTHTHGWLKKRQGERERV